MSKSPLQDRKPRADALRNRALLVAAAKDIFAEKGSAATLDEIAKAANVGIGTLYRHFPTRDDIVDAVYQAESEQIIQAAEDLSHRLPPVEALRAWLLQFVDYMMVKQGMSEILKSSSASPRALKPSGSQSLQATFEGLINRAKASGDIQLDGDAFDLLRAIAGVLSMNSDASRHAGARRFVDVLMAGLKTSAR